MWNLFIIVFVVVAAVCDLWWKKIPKILTVTGFFAGLIFHWFHGNALSAIGAALLGLVVGVALFSLGAIGGGDVKLISALGAMLGFEYWARAMELAVFVAAGMAVIQVIRHRAVRQTVRNMGAILAGLLTNGWRAHPTIHVNNPSLIRSPFGLAAAIGTVIATWWPW
jgi:prepilin peptidase CpaA